MENEWGTVPLADICRQVRYGYTASATERRTGTQFLRVTDIASGPIDWDSVPYCEISDADYERHRLEPGDIVIARMGTIGVSALIRELGRAVAASYLIRHRLDEERADPRFVAYSLRSPAFWDFVWTHGGGGAVQPNINAKVLGEFQLPLPPLPEQRAIAEVLGALDDKIELNERMNATLDEMTRSLFRSWFVDFDPVCAKAEGRQPSGMDVATAALFPDSFDESLFGDKPSGWPVGPLADLCVEVIRGVTPQYAGGSGRWVLNQRCNRGFAIDWSQLKELDPALEIPQNKFARRSDVLVNSLGEGTRGRVHFFRGEDGRYAIDQHISVCRPISTAAGYYLYNVLSDRIGQERLETLTTGSTGMTMLNISKLRAFDLLRPPDALLNLFGDLVHPWWSLIETNERESAILTDLRDMLLPKLISGELRVREAAEAAEAAV